MAKSKKILKNGQTLTELAYAQLKRAIVRGELGEGVFLLEANITGQFKVGRTPFREACNRFHRERLLEVIPRRGYLVPELTFAAVRDLFEARIGLEGIIAELAVGRADSRRMEELESLALRHPDGDSVPPDPEALI